MHLSGFVGTAMGEGAILIEEVAGVKEAGLALAVDVDDGC